MTVLSHLRRRNEIKERADEEHKHDDLHHHHSGIEARRFFDSPNQNDRDERDDTEREKIEDDWITKDMWCVIKQPRNLPGRAKIRRQPSRNVDAKIVL